MSQPERNKRPYTAQLPMDTFFMRMQCFDLQYLLQATQNQNVCTFGWNETSRKASSVLSKSELCCEDACMAR